ncbi:recQ-like DNA helicase BLM [Centruroides vittatus]|uniref:recQ-like DNA helicase BLM n=1 Tax=Centruroides vittatus TaxID=120091 RepID=UPI00350FFE06
MDILPHNNLKEQLSRFSENRKNEVNIPKSTTKKQYSFKKPSKILCNTKENAPEIHLVEDNDGRFTSTPKHPSKHQSTMLSFVKKSVNTNAEKKQKDTHISSLNISLNKSNSCDAFDDLDDFEIPFQKKFLQDKSLQKNKISDQTDKSDSSNLNSYNNNKDKWLETDLANKDLNKKVIKDPDVSIQPNNSNDKCFNNPVCIPETQLPDYSEIFPDDDDEIIATQCFNDLDSLHFSKIDRSVKCELKSINLDDDEFNEKESDIVNQNSEFGNSIRSTNLNNNHEDIDIHNYSFESVKEQNLFDDDNDCGDKEFVAKSNVEFLQTNNDINTISDIPESDFLDSLEKDLYESFDESDFLQETNTKNIKKNELNNNSQLFQDKIISETPIAENTSSQSINSLKEINYSIMTKICDLFQTNTAAIKTVAGLKELLEVRSQVLNEIKKLEPKSKITSNKKPSLSSRLSSKYNNNNLFQQVTEIKSSSSSSSSCTLIESNLHQTKSSELKVANSRENNSLLNDIQSPVITSNVSSPNISKSFSNKNFNSSEQIQTIEDIQTQDTNIKLDEDLIEDFTIKQTIEKQEIDYTSALYGTQKNKEISKFESGNKLVAGYFCRNHRDDGASDKYKGLNFPHSEEMMSFFSQIFGLQKFRHNQLETINAALLGEDCFVLMPTGGGKSLCYQLPALMTKGVTVVISPLRSLIQDQVQKLWTLDIPANHLSGDRESNVSDTIYKQLLNREPSIKLLYVTPEKISASNKLSSVFQNLFKRKLLARFVIDEAHCVSQWGHDFRPDYKRLKILREKYPGVPFMALTATATPRVRTDILHQLNMPQPKWFLQSFNRPNLKYEIVHKKAKNCIQDIINLIKTKFNDMSGIIYCLSRNDCDQVAADLLNSGIQAISYHAGIENENRNHVQEMWINDKCKVICATIAFGMGIDKPDVRFVIHHSIPKSIEGYYQESGRSGRDGERSWCILYYNYHDFHRIKRMIIKDTENQHAKNTHLDNLYRMVNFCENKTDCRRVQMLNYFGEIFNKDFCLSNPLTACDNCLCKDTYETCDVTEDSIAIVQCIAQLVGESRKKNYTLTYFVDIFKGSNNTKIISAGHNKLALHGRGQTYGRADAERLLRKLVLDRFLEEDLVITQMEHAVSYVKLGCRAQELLNKQVKVKFTLKKGSRYSLSVQPIVEIDDDSEIKQLANRCYAELIDVSKSIAAESGIHYTNVINVEALRQMSREMPMTENEMLHIPHVTKIIYEKYGAQFLNVTQKYGYDRAVLDAEQETHNSPDEDSWLNCASTSKYALKKGTKRKYNRRNTGNSAKKFKNEKNKGKWTKNKFSSANKSKASNISNLNTKNIPQVKSSASTSKVKTKEGLRLLPAPKPKTSKTNDRSFLPPPKVYYA